MVVRIRLTAVTFSKINNNNNNNNNTKIPQSTRNTKCISGESFTSLQYLYRIGRTTIGEIVNETCVAIISSLQQDYMKVIKHLVLTPTFYYNSASFNYILIMLTIRPTVPVNTTLTQQLQFN